MDIRECMKRKSISDSRNVENISDKRLRIEVQPAQINGVERTKRFVDVQQAEKDKQNFDVDLPPLGKMDALISILGHKAWCCLVHFFLCHWKTLYAKVVSILVI